MYSDIIKQNMENAEIRWWPKYAYHFTDIRNAVNILALGRLYSRLSAEQFNIMQNDNASRQVIDMTSKDIKSFVRFYFRPLTPTQYHNEGYKHKDIRYDGDENANVPVPIFLFFDLEKLLQDPAIKFSERCQAGHGDKVCDSEEEFAAFDFKKIYNPRPSKDEVAYKQAEIICPDYYDIDKALVGIACRTEIERQSLLNMLQEKNRQSFYKYKDKIRIVKDDLFEYNGLFVSDCDYNGESLSIRFSDTKSKHDYAIRTVHQKDNIDINSLTVSVIVEFEWHNRNGVLFHRDFKKEMSYLNPHSLVFSNVPIIQGAKEMSVKVYFDTNLVCFMKYKVSESGVL